jgi:metallo-beta-lactamase class B
MWLLLLMIAAAAADAGETPRDRTAVTRKQLVEYPHLYQCYEAERAKTPDLAGQVRARVHLKIAPSGTVTVFPLLDSTIGNARVEACILQVIRGWRFPPVSNSQRESWFGLTFRPQSDVVGSVKVGGGTVDFMRIGWQTIVHRTTDAHGVPANGLIAELPTGLVLVDTGWTDAQTEAILRWGTENLQRRWIGAIITHDHGDRDGGLGALHRAHIPVAALDLTVAKLRARGDLEVTALFAAKDGVFRDPRGFEAFYPGPGHAPDNIVLAFPALLFGGCLIKSLDAKELGFTGDADLAGWPAAVRNVETRYTRRIVVPGHGAVDDSGTALQHTVDLLTAARGKSATED